MLTLHDNPVTQADDSVVIVKLHKKEQDFYIFLTIIVAFYEKK